MNDQDLLNHLMNNTPLALDTCIIWGNGLLDLADGVNRWNCQNRTSVRLILGTLVYTERLVQEHQKRGGTFRLKRVLGFLDSKNIKVEPFTFEDAQAGAEWLTKYYADHNSGSKTVDWLIATQAEVRGWILVTDDNGPEFKNLTRRVRGDQLKNVLPPKPE